ncbi:Protein kinase domain [Legionella donaldsonii]|uniref:Protein kinase domain n=1 Tax=Legionella donaldsonii TaxID=45060 RepID=A0A378J490_9GAMM|nr:serine/threonine-protein kinase [Legionella donaldsonii]STX42574.1 Protein kinase domain [Legionella donaldsonii]
MGDREPGSEQQSFVLFPVKLKNGKIVYYASDYSEPLGGSVYKGYQCTLRSPQTDLKPCRVKKEDITLDKTQVVALKFYEAGKHPSPYQFYDSEIATLKLAGKDVLIMEYIDGFHIHPEGEKNPQLRELNFFQVVDVAWQLIQGLNSRHYNNTLGPSVVHGDIKGSNVKIRIKKTLNGMICQVDVCYLDDDYSKPIVSNPQCPQGTLEHFAIEILDGYYSESSDFFALSPLLLTLFGANNPLQRILDFRNTHPSMDRVDLVKQYIELGFSSDGLFEHFEKKPEAFICELVKNFIMKMAAKYKKDRPNPEAILEFFTALRQFCLIDEANVDRDFNVLRLRIAAQDKTWLTEIKYPILLLSLENHFQDRLIALMDPEQRVNLHNLLLNIDGTLLLREKLRQIIAVDLAELSKSIKPPSRLSSLFSSPVTQKDLAWLIRCYEQNDRVEFHSPTNKAIRKKLKDCSETHLASLISVITAGFASSTELIKSPQMLSMA